MNVLRNLRKTVTRPRVLLVLLLLGLPVLASAQADVPVAAGGIASLAGTPPVYNGQYVLKQTDFGFLWLDTVALTGGLVQVEAKCWVGQPVPVTNLYVIGDCNGITDILSTGSVVLARQLSGQCGAATRGCNGPRDDGHAFFVFALGTWDLLTDNGTGNEAGVSTQTADLQGRTWTALQIDLSHFAWHVTRGPTIPVANATFTNLTTSGGTNYLGDKVKLTDTSQSATSIVSVAWDVNRVGPFAPDAAVGTATSIIGYFPCDPASSGNFSTGAGCAASVGAPATTSSWAQQFSERSTNAAGYTSQNVFTSPAIQFSCAPISIVGYTGASGTCAQTGGTLRVLSGGNADASATPGNINDASTSIVWNFTPGGQLNGKTVQVPAGAQTFDLTVTFPGGWQSTVRGASVRRTDLLAAFSLNPTTAVVNDPLTLTNQMQIGPTATLNSVDYRIYQGSPTNTISSGTLAASFLPVSGTATVSAPGTSGSYTMELTYRFNGTIGGAGQTSVVTQPFATWSPAPQIEFDPLPLCIGSCQLTIGTQYLVWDAEAIPITPHPGALWELVYSGGAATTIGTSADANAPILWTPSTSCSSCTLRVTVSSVVSSVPVTISNGTSPTGVFFTVDPCRVADTRGPIGPYGGPSLGGGNDRSFVLWGRCGIPVDARAVSLTVTVTNTNAAGDVRVFPAGIALPLVSTVNWRTGQTRSCNVIVPLGSGGAITVHLDQSMFDTSDLIIDVAGWFN
jgi:hypothetical protein